MISILMYLRSKPTPMETVSHGPAPGGIGNVTFPFVGTGRV